MEEKKTLKRFEQYSFLFRNLVEIFFLKIKLVELPEASVEIFDRYYSNFCLARIGRPQRIIRLFPTFFFWFEWFNLDLLGSCFYQKRAVTAVFGPVLALGCCSLWRILFACIGNRSLVGWRRVALIGFFTKLRFVTRYNYRKRSHYFWRRSQRRWRLFKTRRRLYFFSNRYKKLRRLRYNLSFNCAWRAAQRLQRLGVRWRGSNIRLFICEFLRWKTFLLRKRLPATNVYRRLFWRQFSVFLFYRYGRKFCRFQYQYESVVVTSSRKRLWRHKRQNLIGHRLGCARDFKRVCKNSLWLARARRLRRFINTRALYCRKFWYASRRFSKLHAIIHRPRRRLFKHFKHYAKRRKRRFRRFKSRRFRWRYKQLKKVRTKRRRRLRRFLRRFRPRRRLFASRLKRLRIPRKHRRRIKRRVKRRRKYFPRWRRSFRLSRDRRRRIFRYQKRLHFQWKSFRYFITRHLVPVQRKFFIYKKPQALPLLAVVSLKRLWGRSPQQMLLEKKTLFASIQQEQSSFRARHTAWDDEEAPDYQRLSHFQRWRQASHFGRYRRWLCSLFINGRRGFYYRERKVPLMRLQFSPQKHLTLNVSSFVVPIRGGRLQSNFRPMRRRYFWRRLRANFKRIRLCSRIRKKSKSRVFRPRFRQRKRRLRKLRRRRFRQKRRWFRKFRMGTKKDSWLMIFKLRHALFKKFRRRLFLRRFYSPTLLLTRLWCRGLWWHRRILNLRYGVKRYARRRAMERFLYRTFRKRLVFRIRLLQNNKRRFLVRRSWIRSFLFYKQCIRRQLVSFIRFRRFRRLALLLRARFRKVFYRQLNFRLQQLSSPMSEFFYRQTSYLRRERLVLLDKQRVDVSCYRPAAFGVLQKSYGLFRRRLSMTRLSRYISPRGFGLFKAHSLLTRRYPSVYDFETFNYLFSSSFLYNRFTQKGNLWRSQIIVMSVLRYLRPYSAFHLVRFIERFLVEGFPIYFELSSLKQSNKEQPFPVPINLSFFRTYMLKAIATRFRARRHAVSFQAALLTELWSWYVDPTASILHDFLVNHYAVGMDSRFFVHYRWKVKR